MPTSQPARPFPNLTSGEDNKEGKYENDRPLTEKQSGNHYISQSR